MTISPLRLKHIASHKSAGLIWRNKSPESFAKGYTESMLLLVQNYVNFQIQPGGTSALQRKRAADAFNTGRDKLASRLSSYVLLKCGEYDNKPPRVSAKLYAQGIESLQHSLAHGDRDAAFMAKRMLLAMGIKVPKP